MGKEREIRILLSDSVYSQLELTAGGRKKRREQIELAIHSYVDAPITVFSAYCEITDYIYYGLSNRSEYYRKDYQYYLVRGDNPFSKEVALRGCNEFDFKVIGNFKNIREALSYREFLINKTLNEGKKVYNLTFESMPFTRYVSVSMNQNTLMNFLTKCKDRGKTANQIIKKMIIQFNKKY